MQVTNDIEVDREVEVDATVEEVWRFLTDPEELVGWIGEDLRHALVRSDDDRRRLTWTWAPDGHESTVELTAHEVDGRTVVHVVERSSAATSGARACSARRWDGALLELELRGLTWSHRLLRR